MESAALAILFILLVGAAIIVLGGRFGHPLAAAPRGGSVPPTHAAPRGTAPAAAPALGAPFSPKTCQVHADTDNHSGAALRSAPAATPTECCEVCASSSTCSAAVLLDKTCYLKSNADPSGNVALAGRTLVVPARAAAPVARPQGPPTPAGPLPPVARPPARSMRGCFRVSPLSVMTGDTQRGDFFGVGEYGLRLSWLKDAAGTDPPGPLVVGGRAVDWEVSNKATTLGFAGVTSTPVSFWTTKVKVPAGRVALVALGPYKYNVQVPESAAGATQRPPTMASSS